MMSGAQRSFLTVSRTPRAKKIARSPILVVDKIDLDPGRRDRGDLDDQRTVHVADDDIDAGQADDFVKLVLPFVDASIAGHEGTDLLLALLDALRQVASDPGNAALREIGNHLGVDEQNLLGEIFHNNQN